MAALVTAQVAPNTTETALSFSGVGTTAFTAVPSGKTLFVLSIRVANTDSADHHAFVSRVATGGAGAAAATNRIIPGSVVPALDVIADSDPHVIPANGSLTVKADNANVVFTVSGALL